MRRSDPPNGIERNEKNEHSHGGENDCSHDVIEPHESMSARVETAVRHVGRALANQFPGLSKPLETAWGLYILSYGRLVSWKYSRRHARRTSIRPFELVDVDPGRVDFLVEPSALPIQARSHSVFPKPKFKYAGAVLDGDWDLTTRRFEETDFFRGFEEHFEHGVDWVDTAFFETFVDYIEDGVPMWGCTSRREFEERCRQLDQLYESIAAHGYRSQRELLEARGEDPIEKDATSSVVRFVYDEVTVCVGRDGRLLFKDGRNRLAIAKLLGLDSITVWVMVRHERWQRFRENVAADPSICADLEPRLRTHPDLSGVCAGPVDR